MFNVEHFVDFFNSNDILYKQNYSLKDKNTYKTGGLAKLAVLPNSAEQVNKTIDFVKSQGVDYSVLGAGSNLLISDSGYDGVLISTENLKGISINGNLVTCFAGERVSDFLKQALYNSLGGVEFLNGIPASVGGIVTMNAGCFGKNVGDYVSYVVASSGIYSFSNCEFGYRTSRFKVNKDVVISVCFNLENVEYDQAESKAEYFLKLRKNKQPKGRSCGSVFKNDGYYAGKVIESCNLKGFKMGSARVSERHANFILADQNAKSSDIRRLIAYIKQTVKEKCGILLQEEIEYLGKFKDEDYT